MFRLISFTAMAALAVGVACGSASPGVAKQPPGFAATVLASGPVDSIPAGALFVNYLDLPQAAGDSIKHKHGAGFVYAVQGAHEMDVDGVGPVTIQPGTAAFIGANVVHAHINPGTAGNDWWFVGLRPASSRPLPTVVPGQKELFATTDLTQISQGAYTESLTDNRLQARAVDREIGPSLRVLFVVDGSLTVKGDAGMTGTVASGHGAYSLPGANLLLTSGPYGAHYLAFVLTPAAR